MNFYGSAIGALEESLRACIRERHGHILYFLGLAYSIKGNGILTH